MRIEVDSKDLETLADEITRNCNLLDDCDEEDVDDLIPFHVGEIRQVAEDLLAVALLAKQKQNTKEALPDGPADSFNT